MNIEQANAIALPEILEKIDCLLIKDSGCDLWYQSPFFSKKMASLYVDTIKNAWYDFGEDNGGDVIDFVCAYLESQGEDHTLFDALRWLNNMLPPPTISQNVLPENSFEDGTPLVLQELYALRQPALISYLESRGIPLTLASKYLKELIVVNTDNGKKFHAIGLRNEANGYELKNKFFSGCIAPQSISFIRGVNIPAAEIHIFTGFMDFLSALSYQKGTRFAGDVIILNAVACLPQIFPYIENYTYKKLYTWLDNDTAGARATQALREFVVQDDNLTFKTMNKLYAPHKDVNAWHRHKLEL